MAWYDFLKNAFSQEPTKSYDSLNREGVVFFDSLGRIIGTGEEGFRYIKNNNSDRVTFYDITNDGFGSSPWIYIIVDRIGKGCMSIKLRLEDMEGNPISPRMRQSPRVRELQTLMKSPQPSLNNHSLKKITYTTIVQYLLSGNGYLVGLPHNVRPVQRYNTIFSPLAQNVHPNDNTSTPLTSYDVNYYNMNFTVEAKDVMHLCMPNQTYDINEGHAPLESLRNIWKANNALNKSEQFIHERKGSNAIIYSEGNRAMQPDDKKRMQDQIDKDVNDSGRIGRYTYFPTKIGYIDLAKSFKDLQAIESKNAHRETLAAVYNYPSSLLNDPQTLTYNNIKQLEKTAYARAILPVLDFYLEELNRWLVVENFGLNSLRIGYDVNEIPEMQLMNLDKTTNYANRLDMVVRINDAFQRGSMDRMTAVNTLILSGFTEGEADSIVPQQTSPIQNTSSNIT